MTRRPAGVTVSAIVLGFGTLCLFAQAVLTMVIGVVVAKSPGITASAPGAQQPPAGLLMGIFIGLGVFTLAIAGWALATVVGLVRLRNWARISMLVLGGCLAALAVLNIFGTILTQVVAAKLVLPPGAQGNPAQSNPAMMHVVFLVMGVFWLFVAGIGVWWVVYFAKRSTREAFVPSALPMHSTAQLGTSVPWTDFTVAQPIEAVQYAPVAQPVAALATHEPVPTRTGRPLSMTVLAVLMLVSAASMLITCLLPFPLFLFGQQLTGWHAHVALVALAVLYGLSGYGLLALKRTGWMLAFGMQLIALMNAGMMLTPAYRARMFAYMTSISRSMMPNLPNVPTAPTMMFNDRLMELMMIPGMVFGVIFVAVFLVLLWRARWAYGVGSEQG